MQLSKHSPVLDSEIPVQSLHRSTDQMLTFEEIVEILGYFTDDQRSLAWSPEPPYESTGASDCRRGGSFGLTLYANDLRSRWIRARFRWIREQKKLEAEA